MDAGTPTHPNLGYRSSTLAQIPARVRTLPGPQGLLTLPLRGGEATLGARLQGCGSLPVLLLWSGGCDWVPLT